MKKLFCVLTTIQKPTASAIEFASLIAKTNGQIIVIGDEKGPNSFDLEGTVFYSLKQQKEFDFELAHDLPVGHYCRKNLGYLKAISLGAESIYETDDDNAPLVSWGPRQREIEAQKVEKRGWLNAYSHFSDRRIWPRGFPLDEIAGSLSHDGTEHAPLERVTAPIQQGLANLSPDVDAIWRLVLDEPFEFDIGPSIYLPPGSWCPFNSQSTWWWPEAYPLMYLPSYCSFRMTDIWRSFIAQRCLWELGYGLVFHTAEVIQERNEHNLMRDFADEVDGYLRNKELVNVLANLTLKSGLAYQGENLLHCYQALVLHDFFPEKELKLVNDWLTDLHQIVHSGKQD